MEPEWFRAECERLSRPRLNLRRRQGEGECVAVWGGWGCLPSPPGTWEHRITVACDWLGRNGFDLSGLMGVYANTDDDAAERYLVVRGEPEEGGLTRNGGIGLVGGEDVALPPVDAFETHGREELRRVFEAPQLPKWLLDYEERSPLQDEDQGGVFAILGGWHQLWPEDDAFDVEPGRLVLWTFQDAEPWLEVWQRPSGELEVVSRIT